MTILLALAGCNDATGIWLFQLETGEIGCEITQSENFNDGAYPGGTTGSSEWTEELTETVSPMLLFGQITQHSGKEGTLIVGNEAYPGTLDGGIWTFAWTHEESSTDTLSHQDGYAYTVDVVGTSTTTWTLDISGDTATGSVGGDSNITITETESDEWDPADNGQGFSAMNTAGIEDDDGFGVTNDPEEADCSGSDCEVSESEVCSGTTPLSATWSGFLEEDAYDGVDTAGQNYGL